MLSPYVTAKKTVILYHLYHGAPLFYVYLVPAHQ
jgi:hypothetical protein